MDMVNEFKRLGIVTNNYTTLKVGHYTLKLYRLYSVAS
jgi:hypothetical protein